MWLSSVNNPLSWSREFGKNRSVKITSPGVQFDLEKRVHLWVFVMGTTTGQLLFSERSPQLILKVGGNCFHSEKFSDTYFQLNSPNALNLILENRKWHSKSCVWISSFGVPELWTELIKASSQTWCPFPSTEFFIGWLSACLFSDFSCWEAWGN